MTDWRSLKRHPLSGEYADITGPEWFRFTLKLKRLGVLNNRKVILHEGMILDGYQLFRGCLEVGIEPDFATLPEGIDPREFVEIVNDERRHETGDEREARIKRVAERRAKGESTRKIAEQEGISQTQARKDIEAGNPGEHGGCSPGKVTGRDGKSQAAIHRKPRCERCKRLWPDSDMTLQGCEACKEARKPAKAPNPAPAPPAPPPDLEETDHPEPPKHDGIVRDDAGTVVPHRLVAAFNLRPLIKECGRKLSAASTACLEVENAPSWQGCKKTTDAWAKYRKPLQAAAKAYRDNCPSIVCPDCGGDGAACCGDRGFLSAVEAKEKGKAGAS
jgi:hypothetical protein